jgi:hypothetical protein
MTASSDGTVLGAGALGTADVALGNGHSPPLGDGDPPGDPGMPGDPEIPGDPEALGDPAERDADEDPEGDADADPEGDADADREGEVDADVLSLGAGAVAASAGTRAVTTAAAEITSAAAVAATAGRRMRRYVRFMGCVASWDGSLRAVPDHIHGHPNGCRVSALSADWSDCPVDR